MSEERETRRDADKAADIIRDAGGKVVGRTRLQKIGYLLEATGLGDGFSFAYRHYGPYSEDLTAATWRACLLGLIEEQEEQANWGGTYSIFTASGDAPARTARRDLVAIASNANPIALELAATAAFLAADGHGDAWAETARRKPDKARVRLTDAKALYRQLQTIEVPKRLPEIA